MKIIKAEKLTDRQPSHGKFNFNLRIISKRML